MLLLIAFTVGGCRIFRNLYNPVTVFVSWSMLLLLLSLWCNVLKADFGWQTYALLFSTFGAFTLGAYAGKKTRRGKRHCRVLSYSRLYLSILLLSAVVDVCIVLHIADIGIHYGYAKVFENLSAYNAAILNGLFDGRVYFAGLYMAPPLSMFIQYFFPKAKKEQRVFLIIQFFLCFLPFITVRRDTLFKMILLNLLLWYAGNCFPKGKETAARRRKKWLVAGSVILGAVAFMSLTQLLMHKNVRADLRILGIPLPGFLVDPALYLLGNYPYLDAAMGSLRFQGFLISTLRIPVMYLQRIFGGGLDLATPFQLPFRNVVRGGKMMFNTAPIQYYTYLELGVFSPVFYLLLGFLSGVLYDRFAKKRDFAGTMFLVTLYSVLFWSVREYTVIFLSTWILAGTVLAVTAFVMVKRK